MDIVGSIVVNLLYHIVLDHLLCIPVGAGSIYLYATCNVYVSAKVIGCSYQATILVPRERNGTVTGGAGTEVS